MPTTIHDNRKYLAMSEAEADQLLDEIARQTIDNAVTEAEAERRIADIKANAATVRGFRRKQIEDAAAELERYIQAHPERFVRPRARKTSLGSYGLRTVSNVAIADDEAVIAYAKKHNRTELIKITYTVVKDQVKQAAAAGEEIPGVLVQSGERSFYTVTKSLIDEAKKRGSANQ